MIIGAGILCRMPNLDPQANSKEDTFSTEQRERMVNYLLKQIGDMMGRKKYRLGVRAERELHDAILLKFLLDFMCSTGSRSDETIMMHLCDMTGPERMEQASYDQSLLYMI